VVEFLNTGEVGGIIGIAESGSTTERVYASGAATGGTTAGGLTGYARNSTTVVRNSFAIGSTVTATAFGQRVVARAANGQTATLANNSAIETLVAAKQAQTAVGPTTLNGQTRTVAEARSQATWQTGLGWDFDSVWQWSAELERPVLRSAAEKAPAAGRMAGKSAAVEDPAPAEDAPAEDAPAEDAPAGAESAGQDVPADAVPVEEPDEPASPEPGRLETEMPADAETGIE
jgi:hypothetical protein